MSVSETTASSGAYTPITTGYSLPSGVMFHNLSGFAENWETFDALTSSDGWKHVCGGMSEWKEMEVGTGRITVMGPTKPRPNEWLDGVPENDMTGGPLWNSAQAIVRPDLSVVDRADFGCGPLGYLDVETIS